MENTERKILLTLAFSAPLVLQLDSAGAASVPPGIGDGVKVSDGMYAVAGDRLASLPTRDSTSEVTALPPREDGEASPFLIDFGQWTRCFIGNNSGDVFAAYFDLGGLREVQLTCGEGNKDNGWGYKHIRDGHESDWQAKLDELAHWGLVPNASWDDLMSMANDVNIAFPSYTGGGGNTKCTVGQTAFVSNGVIVQIINSKTVWNTSNGRVITSHPTSSQVCR